MGKKLWEYVYAQVKLNERTSSPGQSGNAALFSAIVEWGRGAYPARGWWMIGGACGAGAVYCMAGTSQDIPFCWHK
jgi:hypothetical protein